MTNDFLKDNIVKEGVFAKICGHFLEYLTVYSMCLIKFLSRYKCFAFKSSPKSALLVFMEGNGQGIF